MLRLYTGPLARVSNLRRVDLIVYPMYDTLVYSWDPPFSLNVTNADPDIIYCVRIYNSSCSTTSQNQTTIDIVHICNVTETNFIISKEPSTDELYEIEVFSRSNVDMASNGTSSFYRGIII